ncbi:MAG: class I SAM-dependent methyltransferase, partial [Propionicimonas sp.]
AAAALQQESLRRRARGKFGAAAAGLFFTTAGLEQATRPGVAAWRAGRLAAAGARRVVDLGCGLGADALAFVDAGLDVVAIERDPVTAMLARANLGERGRVVCADAESVAADLLGPHDAVFLDPARRTGQGRSWRLADLSPSWEFTLATLGERLGCIKAGPGFPTNQLPGHLAATWVSDHGDLVELAFWSRTGGEPGHRSAVLLPAGVELAAGARHDPGVGELGAVLYEPDPAVIRSGGVAALAERLGARGISPGIAYLTGDERVETPFATAFEVLDVLAFDERRLRAWVREQGIGTLEIKVRGLDVDPAQLRRRLKPSGRRAATLVLTPLGGGVRAVQVRRLG